VLSQLFTTTLRTCAGRRNQLLTHFECVQPARVIIFSAPLLYGIRAAPRTQSRLHWSLRFPIAPCAHREILSSLRSRLPMLSPTPCRRCDFRNIQSNNMREWRIFFAQYEIPQFFRHPTPPGIPLPPGQENSAALFLSTQFQAENTPDPACTALQNRAAHIVEWSRSRRRL